MVSLNWTKNFVNRTAIVYRVS